MATYDDPYNPIPRRLREPTPGYSPARLPGTERTVVETPRGGFSPDPAPGLSERDLAPENYAMPFSPTRSMRYGTGDERDLGAPPPPPPPGWRPPMPSELPPARPDPTAPSPLFSGVAGEDFEATRRRGEQVAKLMREQDGPFANPNDWNYVRSYGPRAAAQAVASGRANISGAPAELVAQERERFLRNRTTDLSISPQLRSAARDELAQIERDAAEERRREMWAAEQAGLAERARIAASVPVVGPGGVAAIPNADGGWDVSRPEPAPAAPPAPVSFGGGAGAIPEIGEDGRPTGRYVYQAPPTPDPNAAPWVPGGGATSVNRVTGDVKTAPGSAPDPNSPKNWKKVGSDIVNVVTGERVSGYDARKALDDQIARLRVARANNALLPDAVAQIDAQIAELEAQKQTLGVADAQAPGAPAAPAEAAAQGGASSPSEPSPAPAPAPAPAAAPAPSVAPGGRVPVQTGTAPAPAAPAAPEPKPAPKGYKRLPNGELEYVG